MKFTELQKKVLGTYCGGEFQHIQNVGRVQNFGDSILQFLINEAGDSKDEMQFTKRVNAAIEDMKNLLANIGSEPGAQNGELPDTGIQVGPHEITCSTCFGGPLVVFDNSHIKTDEHAALFKTGELTLPGRPSEIVGVKFFQFAENAMPKRRDAVFEVFRNGKSSGFFFASAFKSLGL